jgi:hypothetical protein
MKRYIISESQLRFIKEQSVIGAQGKGSVVPSFFPDRSQKIKSYKCVPQTMNTFVNYVVDNKDSLMKKLKIDYKTLILLSKVSIGIIGRESKFGSSTETSDNFSEMLRGVGLGSLIDWALEKKYGKNKTQSLGNAQFTPEAWKRYGLDKSVGDYNSSFNSVKQGLGALFSLTNRYKKALNNGLRPEPSVNPILSNYGVIKGIDGTGNHALDMAILSHNMPETKTLYPYCKTNHPLYAASCKYTKISPFEKQKSFDPNSSLLQKVKDPKLKKFPGELTVNQSAIMPNYFPNLQGPNHTAIGYVEEVAEYVKTFDCF